MCKQLNNLLLGFLVLLGVFMLPASLAASPQDSLTVQVYTDINRDGFQASEVQAGLSVTAIATIDRQLVEQYTDSEGYAEFGTLSVGYWEIRTCGQRIEYYASEGSGGALLAINCASFVYLPFIYR